MSFSIKSHTLSQENPDFDKYLLKVEQLCLNINDDLYSNPSRLKTDEWIGLSVYVDDSDNVYGFSSIVHRENFGSGARILNRFYKDPQYRFENNKRKLSSATLETLKSQIELCKTFGYDYAFMSRDTKTIKAWNHYSRYFQFTNWNISDKYYKMLENSWQQIIWTPLKENAEPDMESMTKEEYNDLQKN